MELQIALERLDVIGDDLGPMGRMMVRHKKNRTTAAHEITQECDETTGAHSPPIKIAPERALGLTAETELMLCR